MVNKVSSWTWGTKNRVSGGNLMVKMAPCRIRGMDNRVSSRTWEVVNRD